MEKTAGRILKSNDVKLEGRFHLDAGHGDAGQGDSGQGDSGLANGRNVASAPAQVRVVENHPEFAVIELTCCCGAKTSVRCEYTDVPSAEQRPDQKSNGENKNAS